MVEEQGSGQINQRRWWWVKKDRFKKNEESQIAIYLKEHVLISTFFVWYKPYGFLKNKGHKRHE